MCKRNWLPPRILRLPVPPVDPRARCLPYRLCRPWGPGLPLVLVDRCSPCHPWPPELPAIPRDRYLLYRPWVLELPAVPRDRYLLYRLLGPELREVPRVPPWGPGAPDRLWARRPLRSFGSLVLKLQANDTYWQRPGNRPKSTVKN
jgi:hypothetical protein